MVCFMFYWQPCMSVTSNDVCATYQVEEIIIVYKEMMMQAMSNHSTICKYKEWNELFIT